MQNIFFVILLIAVSILPNSNFKNSITGDLENRLISPPKEYTIEKFTPHSIPEKNDNYAKISSASAAALFIDADSGEILFEKNRGEKLPMASTTKLMTALVALEKSDPNELAIMPNAQIPALDTVMGLAPGDKLTISELLHGLLIESGADASLAISNHVGGSEQKFVALMNEKAKKIGLANTQFTNSIGHDEEGHYSTAEDLTKLSKIALSNKTISEIVGKKTYVAKSSSGKNYYLSNTNKLLGNSNFKGIKTGTTFSAGQCLISYYNDGQRNIIGVLLASPDRFSETDSVIGWIKNSFNW